MNQANISYTRNHLSEMLSKVREGETILIVDRRKPVARLEPVRGVPDQEGAWHTDLVRRGLVQPALQRLDPVAFGALPLPLPRRQGDVLAALLADREDGQ